MEVIKGFIIGIAISAVLFFISLAFTSIACAHVSFPPSVIKQTKNATVELIKNGRVYCTGFWVRNKVLTAKHCVADIKEFVAIKYKGQLYPATVTYKHPYNDVATLTPYAYINHSSLDIAKRIVIGEHIMKVGHGAGYKYSIATGIVSDELIGMCTYPQFRSCTMVSIPLNGGDSGGPVVNMRGEVIGLTSWGYRSAQHLNFLTDLPSVRKASRQ